MFSRTVAHGAQEQHEAKHGLAVAVDRLATKPIGETRAQKACSRLFHFVFRFTSLWLENEQRTKETANVSAALCFVCKLLMLLRSTVFGCAGCAQVHLGVAHAVCERRWQQRSSGRCWHR